MTKSRARYSKASLQFGQPAVHYRVEVLSHSAHLWQVTMTIAAPASSQSLRLPVWIPGSYLVREFSRHLLSLQCSQGGRTVQVTQCDKAGWLVACDSALALEVRYQVYAFDNSVRTACLTDVRGFFNATSVCLMAQDQTDRPHVLELVQGRGMQGWQVATGLTPQRTDAAGFGRYLAADYDELADCPVEMGRFWSGEFIACGVPHRFVVAGALPSMDGERLLRDAQKICETQICFWHAPGAAPAKGLAKRVPFTRYVFMLHAVDESYGGLEHRNSTALIASRRDLPRVGEAKTSEGYTTLLGLISHEYFHTWNVKRLRPNAFARYDYTQENYTDLLWFFEGFTSYYDDLLVRRAGLMDDATYAKLLGKTINQVAQTPGRLVQSVAQASFDAWIKYYRPDENTPNLTVSYYTKGALVALCLDLKLRAEGKTTLDAVMRGLWSRCAGGPMSQDDLLAVLRELSGRPWTGEIKAWVHSTRELPLKALLSGQGLEVHEEPAALAQRLGLRSEDAGGAVKIKMVLSGGAAQAAGLMAGDEWLGVSLAAGRGSVSQWRISKLDDVAPLLGEQKRFSVLVSRDKRLLLLPVALPAKAWTWRLACPKRAEDQWPAV
jgi:predicted metalloprotease with PDZ domain